jgi:hypothetical protein
MKSAAFIASLTLAAVLAFPVAAPGTSSPTS